MEKQYKNSLKAQFIIAMPQLTDSMFTKTVTCICEHTKTGAFGFTINRIHNQIKAASIFSTLNIDYDNTTGSIPVFSGGPVNMGDVFILHEPSSSCTDNNNNQFMITQDLAMNTSKQMLIDIAQNKITTPYIIILGYAGWEPGQLDREIMANAWLNTEVYNDLIFKEPVKKRWDIAMEKIGVNPLLISSTAGNA